MQFTNFTMSKVMVIYSPGQWIGRLIGEMVIGSCFSVVHCF